MEDDTQLLRIEMDTLWATDARRRLTHIRGDARREAPSVAIGTAGAEWIAASRFDVPDDAAAAIESLFSALPPSPDRALPSVAVAQCLALLDPSPSAFSVAAGIGFIMPAEATFDSGAQVVTSNETPGVRKQLRAPAEARWSAEEWPLLIEGALGPWAMAVVDGAVVSICHCARLTDIAAEAGVWTHPDFRGQRHAVAVTTAWASLLRPLVRHVFYSTSEDNTASRRVAARLNAREIGWIWHIDRAATA